MSHLMGVLQVQVCVLLCAGERALRGHLWGDGCYVG
jgi:hypothetical protein